MSEFQTRVKMLKALGVEYHLEYEYRGDPPNREQHDLEIFRSVKMPFSAEEWALLYMSEGQFYLGGCCGAMSHLMDILCHEIRMDSGWFRIRKLEEIAEIMNQHDDASALRFDVLPEGFTLQGLVDIASKPMKKNQHRDVWWWFALIWHITKDFYDPEVPRSQPPHMSEVEKAIWVLEKGLRVFSWEKLFNQHPTSDSVKRANRANHLYRILPALKTLNENIDKLDLGPVEGWALIEKEREVGSEAICSNGYGLCIYDNQKDLEETLELWRRNDKEHQDDVPRRPPIDERIGVRKVRISAKDGIQFLD